MRFVVSVCIVEVMAVVTGKPMYSSSPASWAPTVIHISETPNCLRCCQLRWTVYSVANWWRDRHRSQFITLTHRPHNDELCKTSGLIEMPFGPLCAHWTILWMGIKIWRIHSPPRGRQVGDTITRHRMHAVQDAASCCYRRCM